MSSKGTQPGRLTTVGCQQDETDVARQQSSGHDCVVRGGRRNHLLNTKQIASCALGGHNMQTQFMMILKVTLKLDFFLSNSLGHPEVKDNQSWKQMGYRTCCCVAISKGGCG